MIFAVIFEKLAVDADMAALNVERRCSSWSSELYAAGREIM